MSVRMGYTMHVILLCKAFRTAFTVFTMPHAIVGLCTLELELPELTSLKDKRSILKSLLHRLHNQFNVSAVEVDMNDSLNAAVIAFAVVSNNTAHANTMLSNVLKWIENQFHDVVVVDQQFEIL